VLGGFDTVLVVDFGAQYAQLIARRVRECHVYSEIVPSTMPVAEMLAKRPKAIILSGGPSSVYADGAPPAPSTSAMPNRAATDEAGLVSSEENGPKASCTWSAPNSVW